jgi:hypothetical protein
MSHVTREKFLARTRDYRDVDVSEWFGEGATMRLWQITAADAMKFALSLYDDEAKLDHTKAAHSRARLLVYTLGDASGRLFKEGDEALLENYDAGLFHKLYVAAQELTGYNTTEQELAALFELRQSSKPPSV